MTEDITLLREYVEKRSESAFAELVQRRVGVVYAIALPQVGGDAHLAQDVAQKVFVELARHATRLLDRPTIGGWLYRTTHYTAVDLVRAERRRRDREQRSELMPDPAETSSAATPWDKLWPVINEALSALSDRDRDAVALRFFEGRPFAEIGRVLRLSEEAARKRVERALDRMAQALARRGITSTSGAVAVALAEKAACAAPAGLAPGVTGTALASAAASTGGGILAALGSLKVAALFGTAAAVVAIVGFQQISHAGQAAAPASKAAEAQAKRAREERAALALKSDSAAITTTATPAAQPVAPEARPAVARDPNVLVINLPYLYDNSARTQAFNATIQAKDRIAQTEVDRMNTQGNTLLAEYRNLSEDSEQAKALLTQINALKSVIQTFISATRTSLQAELLAFRQTEVGRITTIVEAYRAEHGFAVAYDSNRKTNVGLALLPAGLDGVDRTEELFAQVNR